MNSLWSKILIKNITLIVFIAFLGLLYIANVHIAERKMLKIEKLKKEVDTVKYRYISVKQKILYTSAPSVIGKKVNDKGLKQSVKPPKVIKMNKG